MLYRLAAALVMAGVSHSARAEDGVGPDASIGDAITVSGQRQAYLGDVPLRILPQEVQTLGTATLERQNITTLAGALDFVAGVSRQNNLGGLFDGYAIRGFQGDENLSGNYLLNGFNGSRGYGGPRDVSNIETIEVVKGPTSALFGRGDPGGVVNIVTKKPFFGRGGYVEASGGSFARRRVEGDLDAALSDRVAVRVTGAYDEGDSFRDFVHRKLYTITPSVLWQANPSTSIGYELDYIRQSLPLDRGVVSVRGRLGVVPRSRFLGEPGDGDVTTWALGHQLQVQHDFSGGWSLLLGASYRESRLSGFATDGENADARQKLFVDGRTLSRQRRYRHYDTGDTTTRAELRGRFRTLGLRHRVQIGADWDWYTLDQRVTRFRPPAVARQTTLAAGDALDIFDPVYGDLPATPAFIRSREHDEQAGIYGQDTIDLAPWLVLRAGGRYDHYEQRIVDRLAGRLTGQERDVFSPQVGVSVLPTRHVTLYASYGRGFRPNTGFSAAGDAFAPERTRAYEVGAKLDAFGGMLTGSVALFTMRRSNVLTADPINSGFSLAIGRARSRGVEAFVQGKLPWDMRVTLNYAYTDAVIAREAVDPNFGFALRRGDPLLDVPRNSASALVDQGFDLLGRHATVGAKFNYVSARTGQTGYRFPDGSLFRLPAYAIVGLTAAIDLTDRVGLLLDVTNLLDKTYYTASYSRVWVTPGPPRQVMGRVRFRL